MRPQNSRFCTRDANAPELEPMLELTVYHSGGSTSDKLDLTLVDRSKPH